MNEKELIQLGREILNEMNGDCKVENYIKITPKLKKMREYIINNPNDKNVKYFIEALIDCHKNIVLNNKLIEAFNLPDDYYFYKQLQIYLNMPCTLYPYYKLYLNILFNFSNEILQKPYAFSFYLLEKYCPNILSNQYIQAISTFIKENESIMNGIEDDYNSLKREKELYNLARQNYNFEELYEFSRYDLGSDENKTRMNFMNKRIGNIGELYIYELISKQFFSYFVARDIKNGFGYDIYYFDLSTKVENLVEVKTTTKYNEKDSFILSENEYRIMKSCVNNPNSEYIICRVAFDNLLNPVILDSTRNVNYLKLTMRDNSTLVDIENEEIQYKLYPLTDKIYFEKLNLKERILTK